jgi:hypothetical protein
MKLRYLEITREFHLARQIPRHLIPLPASAAAPIRKQPRLRQSCNVWTPRST